MAGVLGELRPRGRRAKAHHRAARGGRSEPPLYAKALLALLIIARRQSIDLGTALEYGERALALAREVGDRRCESGALAYLGWVKMSIDAWTATGPLVEAVAAARAADDAFGTAIAMNALAFARFELGEFDEACAVLEENIAHTRDSGDVLSLRVALFIHGACLLTQGRPVEAERWFHEVYAVGAALWDGNLEPQMTGLLALAAAMRGDEDAARRLADEAVRVAGDTGHYRALGTALQAVAWLERSAGNVEAVEAAAAESATANRITGQRTGSGTAFALGAWAAMERGDVDRAGGLIDEAEVETAHSPPTFGFVLAVKAWVARRSGDLGRAEDAARQSLAHSGDAVGATDALETLGGVLAELGEHDEAARLLGAARTLRVRTGLVRWRSAEEEYAADVAIVREALGEDDFAKAWTEGASLSTDDAIAYATRGRGERRRPAAGWASLTPTEIEVVKLAAQGLTNPRSASGCSSREGR